MRIQTLIMIGAVGCVDVGVETREVAKTKPPCITIDNRSLVENDPAIVTDARFSLERVFEQIRLTTPTMVGAQSVAVPSAPDMFAQLYAGYGECGESVDPQGYGIRCRAAESSVAQHDPFTGSEEGLHFQPVAVLGRFDMANAKLGTCGESRIVYWKDRGPVVGKAGVIVELHTSPVLVNGRPSCDPIAQFWASLSAESDSEQRAAMLESYFFVGLPGMAFPPVSAQGAGWSGAGQLRSNNFVDTVQWNLRESKWQAVCSSAGCAAQFVVVDTKNSPSEKLFAGTHEHAAAFEHWFLGKTVEKLALATTPNELSLGNDPLFNAHESISQPLFDDPNSVLYARVASFAMRGKIAAKLTELGSTLTVDNVLDRATAVTCAGCHRVSRNTDLGGGLVFPAPLGFVHVGETGAVSPAMRDHFLPKRRELLQRAICGGLDEPAADETLSGHGLDEPN